MFPEHVRIPWRKWVPQDAFRRPSRKKPAESFYHSLQKKGEIIGTKMSLKTQSIKMTFEYINI